MINNNFVFKFDFLVVNYTLNYLCLVLALFEFLAQDIFCIKVCLPNPSRKPISPIPTSQG